MLQLDRPGELLLSLVAVLATWRLTHLFMYEAGPWFIITRLRKRFGVRHDRMGLPDAVPAGNVFACFLCFSVWSALVVVLLLWLAWWVLAPFAVSGAAIMVERWFSRPNNGKS